MRSRLPASYSVVFVLMVSLQLSGDLKLVNAGQQQQPTIASPVAGADSFQSQILEPSLLGGTLVSQAMRQDSHMAMQGRFVGTNACVQCHKNGHDCPTHAVAGKEYSIWVNRDRHSCAYNTLFNEQSKQIAKNLKLQTAPHKNGLCLNCHSSSVPAERLAPDNKLSLADGVGCESCHGGAENWLVPHKLPDWKYWSASEKESLGFVDTDNLASRTRKCVQCHVGSGGRDVNHDLIAAGHPRLYFEMSAYQAKMPRHWSRTKDLQQNYATAEARLWLVGQFVTASAALDLLENRAAVADSPWPEFAEYACYSCHHDLEARRWKDGGNLFKNGVGQPAWGTWHFSLAEQLSQDVSLVADTSLAGEVDRLRSEMRKVLPDRDVVAAASSDLKRRFTEMADYLSRTSLNELQTIEISNQLFDKDLDGGQLNWDGLTQQYLAAVAIRQALIDTRRLAGRFDSFVFQDSKSRLIRIRDLLKFIEDHNGPQKLDAAQGSEINRSFSGIFQQLRN